MNIKEQLLTLIKSRKATVGVVGLGYVGLPLLIEFAKKGFPVIGLDIDRKKVVNLDKGASYIRHIPASAVKSAIADNSHASATTDFRKISKCKAVIICVPTPLTEHRDPDMSYIVNTSKAIAPHIKKGQVISLESTTYPGTTEEVMIPILESGSKLKAGRDFFVCFSPEREDPSNPKYSTATIPKVVGGIDKASQEVGCALYGSVVVKTVPVSSCAAAEATKLVENIFRSINIAMVNELKMIFTAMGIDIWEVIRAASTKPFGYMPFYPGPGLGGHCIPIDPFYLTWKAKEYGIGTKFIELAGEINTSMPDYVIRMTADALNVRGKSIKGTRILLVGLAYKQNVDDDRESPTYIIWEKLNKLGAKVSYYDPYCPVVRPSREHSQLAGIKSAKLSNINRKNFDCAIILTAHECVDHDKIAKGVQLTVDTRGICKEGSHVIRA